MERNDSLIKKKIYKYMLTGVMTTIALQLGNVVDAMIVGNLIGSLGNGAVTASTPYVYVLQAAAILTPILIPGYLSFVGAEGKLLSMISDYATVYSFGMPVLSFTIVMAYPVV